MKKLINRPEAIVEEMVEGLAATYPGLRRLPGHTVLVRADAGDPAVRERCVALISGGGSGHEPAHAGYVGRGMLTAAVAGEVFTSPSPDAILAAIRAVAGPRGVLLIVKNYTGDRLNFGLAAELARAEGVPVELAVVADDVALPVEGPGRRGLAGTVLVHKVAGAAAEAGLGLPEVAAEARAAAEAVRTMGVALSPCTVPAAGTPGFALGDDEVELGLGIHGEPGVRRERLEPADRIVEHLIGQIVADGRWRAGDRLALLVNNLGATPTMELAIVARRALALLTERGLAVERVYLGTFLSALEMAGISLSVLPVDDHRLARLDAPTTAPAWPNAADRPRTERGNGPRQAARSAAPQPGPDTPKPGPPPPLPPRLRALDRAFRHVAEALGAAAPRLNALDQAVGDGDIGESLRRGAVEARRALGQHWTMSRPAEGPEAVAQALQTVAVALQRAMGGTSGPLYAVFLLRASNCLRSLASDEPRAWAEAFEAGCQGLAELGGARPGDRTMLDALLPASRALRAAIEQGRSPGEAPRAAAEAAEAGARATAEMPPRLGRSSYLGSRALGHPDPGAEAVAVWLRALAEILAAPASA